GGSGSPVPATTTSTTIGTLSPSTEYRFQVRARLTSPTGTPGNEAISNEVSATTLAAAGPTSPTNFQAQATSSANITLTWNAVTGANSYRLRRSTTVSGPFSVINATAEALTTTRFDDDALVQNQMYYYKLETFKAGVFSTPPATANAKTGVNVVAQWNGT